MMNILLFVFLLVTNFLLAQPYSNQFTVIQGNDTLPFPWVGGFDNPRFTNLDLNGDGINDLIVFDKQDNKILPFLHLGPVGTTNYRFAPEFISIFPHKMYKWVLMLDYNCDNEPDLFTSTEYSSNVLVYRNTRSSTGVLGFEMAFDTLLVDLLSGPLTGLYASDIPGIADVDFDGDIDFIVSDALGTRVELYRNNATNCGDFQLQLNSMCWGHFNEIFSVSTISAQLNQPCFNELRPDSLGKTMHAGGMLLALQLNGDSLIDLLMTDDGPTNVLALYNGGSRRFAHITNQDTAFPSYSTPVNIHYFPAVFSVDIDADGINDLMATPNGYEFPSPSNPMYFMNYDAGWYYKNVSSNNYPNFQLQQTDFFYKQTIDGGSRSIPVIFDEDRDGDLDMLVFIDNKTIWNSQNYVTRKEWRFYRNITNNFQPTFQLETSNFKGFNFLITIDTLKNVHPTVADIDNDGDMDLFLGNSRGTILFFENTSNSGSAVFQYVTSNFANVSVQANSAPNFADVDNDGDLDLIVGISNGKLNFYENVGTPASSSWAMPITNWGNADVTDEQNPYVGNAKPFWFDVDNNQIPDLVVGNLYGSLVVYEVPNINAPFTYKGFLFGERISKSTAPWIVRFHPSDSISFFTGCIKGGIYLFRDVTGLTTAQNSKDLPHLTISPNPVGDVLKLSSNEILRNVTIYDISGRIVYQGECNNSSQEVEFSHLQSGLYLISVQTQNGYLNKKFVKN